MKRQFDTACRQYQVKQTVKLENLWTNNISWPADGMTYDDATQTYTIPSGSTKVNEITYTLPKPIPAGTTITVTVFFDSGRYEATRTSFYVGGIDAARSWQAYIGASRAKDLTGITTTRTYVTTADTTHFAIILSNHDTVVTEAIQFRVMFVIGDNPDEIFKPYGMGQNEWHDGLKSGFPSVKMFGKTEQQTYSGKNMFDVSRVPVRPNVIHVESDCVIVVNRSVNGYTASTAKLRDLAPNLVVGKQYTFSFETESSCSWIYLAGDNRSWRHGECKTVDEIMLESQVVFYGMSEQKGDPDTMCRISKIQIEEGETLTAYEPYINGIPAPNPNCLQEVKANNATVRSLGKNLFNPESTDYIARDAYSTGFLPKYENGIYYPPGVEGDSEQAMLCIPVEAGAVYTLSYEVAVGSPGWGNVFAFSGKNNRIAEKHVQLKGGVIPTPYTFTVPDGYEYVGIAPAYNTTRYEVGLKNIQLEKGSVATVYEPYFDGGEATAPNLMCAVDGSCQSTYDSQTGEFVNWWDKLVFDGSEAWSAIATNDDQHHGFYVNNVLSESAIAAAYWSNQASPQVGYKALDGTPGFRFSEIYYHTLTVYDFGFYDGALEDKGVANWKAHLAAHPLEVWVARNEPEVTNIGPNRLTCPTGYGQIIQVAGDIPDSPLEIKYLAHGGNVK